MAKNIKSVPPFQQGEFLHADDLEAIRERVVRSEQVMAGMLGQTLSVTDLSQATKPRYIVARNESAEIPEYSVFGIKDLSSLDYNTNFEVEVDLASTKTDWLLTNFESTINSNSRGYAIPINDWQPSLLRYIGSTPAINDQCGVTNGAVDKDATDKVLVAVSNPDTVNNRCWFTRLGALASTQVRIFEFDTDAAFTTSDNTVSVTPTKSWVGELPGGGSISVWNSGNIFFGDDPGLWGVAVWNETDERFQIIQLECVSPSQQEAYASSSALSSFSYDSTPQTIPFDTFGQDAGDLVQIELNGELTFTRDAKGSVRIGLGANWSAITGNNVPDVSTLQFEIKRVAGSYAPAEAGTKAVHNYVRLPPTDYLITGSTYRSFWWDETVPGGLPKAGDQLRITAATSTEVDTLIDTMNDASLEIQETIG